MNLASRVELLTDRINEEEFRQKAAAFAKTVSEIEESGGSGAQRRYAWSLLKELRGRINRYVQEEEEAREVERLLLGLKASLERAIALKGIKEEGWEKQEGVFGVLSYLLGHGDSSLKDEHRIEGTEEGEGDALEQGLRRRLRSSGWTRTAEKEEFPLHKKDVPLRARSLGTGVFVVDGRFHVSHDFVDSSPLFPGEPTELP